MGMKKGNLPLKEVKIFVSADPNKHSLYLNNSWMCSFYTGSMALNENPVDLG